MLQNEEVDFEAFTETVEATERQQAQQSTAQKGFDVPDCVEVGSKAIVRFVNGVAETALDQGKPGSGRAKLFNVGWVRDDNDKPFFLVLPAIIKNKAMYNSTLVNFIDKVLSKVWVDNPNPQPGQPKGSYRYLFEDRNDYGQQQKGEMTLQQIFQKVYKSGVNPSSQFYATTRSWRGQTVYVANVIDRLDYEWHKKNKKTKLLMRKLTVKDGRISRKEVSLHAIGAPLKELTSNYGTALNYDVLIVPGAAPTDKFTLKNVSILKSKDFWEDVKSVVTEKDKSLVSVENGFTAEEATWEPIDIDKFYRLTSTGTILKHFGKTIRNFDNMTGSNFYEMLKQEADADAKARKAEDPKNAETNAPSITASAAPTAQALQQAATSSNAMRPTPTQTPVQQAVEAAPAPVEPSPEAKADIDSFYDSLD